MMIRFIRRLQKKSGGGPKTPAAMLARREARRRPRSYYGQAVPPLQNPSFWRSKNSGFENAIASWPFSLRFHGGDTPLSVNCASVMLAQLPKNVHCALLV